MCTDTFINIFLCLEQSHSTYEQKSAYDSIECALDIYTRSSTIILEFHELFRSDSMIEIRRKIMKTEENNANI